MNKQLCSFNCRSLNSSFICCLVYFLAMIPSCYGENVVSDHYDGERYHNKYIKNDVDFSKIAQVIKKFTRRIFQSNKEATKLLPKVQRSKPQKYVIKPLTATFINHATVLLQIANINIITDPIYAKRASPISFLGPKRDHLPGVDFDHLPPIHIVLISHNHYDHMDLQTLIKLYKKSQPIFLVPMGNKKIITKERYQS